MRGSCADTDVLFTCGQIVVKGLIVGIGRPRETVGVIYLDMVPTGVCGDTGNTNQER